MDLTQCADALTNQYGAIAAGQQQMATTLSKDHLNTVMGAGLKAGIGDQAIAQGIENNPTLKALIDSAPNADAMRAAVSTFAKDCANQSAVLVVAEATSEVQQQILAPANASLSLQRSATNKVASAGDQVKTIAQADQVGLSVRLVEVRNEYAETSNKLDDFFKEIHTIETTISTHKKACDLLASRSDLTLSEKSVQISQFETIDKHSQSRLKECYKDIHCLVSGITKTVNDFTSEDVNARREVKDLSDLEIPKNLKDEKRGREFTEILERFLQGREDVYGTITPALRRISRDLDPINGLYWKPPSLDDDYNDIKLA